MSRLSSCEPMRTATRHRLYTSKVTSGIGSSLRYSFMAPVTAWMSSNLERLAHMSGGICDMHVIWPRAKR